MRFSKVLRRAKYMFETPEPVAPPQLVVPPAPPLTPPEPSEVPPELAGEPPLLVLDGLPEEQPLPVTASPRPTPS